jgi:CelD/BcsL family acetyltransferase involved in cellulose biosynthesis
VETRRTDDGLAGLGPEWDDLFARCAAATPFQSHAWLESWWQAYGVPGQLRLVVVRVDDRLVGAAALRTRRHWCGTVLTPLGDDLSDFTDVLLDDELAAPAARAMANALAVHRGWRALDFPETRPGSRVAGALRDAWPGRRWELPASVCLELPATPMVDLVDELPSHARKTVKRRLNQIGRLGLDVRPVPADEADRAVADLLRLHSQQWRGRGVNPEHLRPRFAAHLGRAVGRMIAAGEAELLEYRLGDRLLASNLIVVGPDLAGGYLYGADPELRDLADVTTLLLSTTLPVAHRRGCTTMSMLRGAEPHKLRWRPTESVNRRIMFARPGSTRGAAYATAVRARRGAVRLAKERLPWLRDVRDRARILATKLSRGADR